MDIILYIVISSLLSSGLTFYIINSIYKNKKKHLSDLKIKIEEHEEEIFNINKKIDKKRELCKLIIENETENVRKKHSKAKKYVNEINKKVSQKREKYNAFSIKLQEQYSLMQNKRKLIEEESNKLNKKIQRLVLSIEEKNKRLSEIDKNTKKLQSLERRSIKIKNEFENNSQLLSSKKSEISKNDELLKNLKSEVDLYSLVKGYVDYGIYQEPEYLYETPERYQAEIKNIRDRQKELIKENEAVKLAEEIEIEGSSKTANAVLKGQAKLMLRAFNIECDNLLEKLKPSNFDRTLERIEKIAEGLEKITVSLSTGITLQYIQYKFEECRLLYEYKLKKAAQDEEQRLIREKIKEEARVAKEYENTIKEANREEKLFKNLLDKAQKQLKSSHEGEKDELQNQIMLLETQLEEAEEKAKRAKSMAEQTRKGHVYIISNIGSFGDEVYKIGLTRRLDPQERIKELGGASVPFPFDVHAMIYCDDAPSLEKSLHQRFNHARINAVNRRKEFFKVSLDEIKSATKDLTGNEANFSMTAIAEEYHETLRLLGGIKQRLPT